MGAVLRFPAHKGELIEKETAPVIEKLDLQNTRTLHETVKHVLEGASIMIEYVDSNRPSARKMGVESIAVELSSMVDSGKLGSVKDALYEALSGSKPAYITREGFSYLQRAEKLLSEGIKAFSVNGRPMFSGGMAGPSVEEAQSTSDFSVHSNNLIIFGVVGIICVTVAAICFSRTANG